jgi:hypothetical protein
MRRAVKIGDAVSVTFLDHCERNGDEGSGPMLFEALGRVTEIAKEYLTIAPWIAPDQVVDNNTDTYVILRSTIKQLRRLK